MLLIADSYAIATTLVSASAVVTQWGSFMDGVAIFQLTRAFAALLNIPLVFIGKFCFSRSLFSVMLEFLQGESFRLSIGRAPELTLLICLCFLLRMRAY